MEGPSTSGNGGVEVQSAHIFGAPGTATPPTIHPVEDAEQRVRRLSAAVRARYGDDPLFDALIDEAACLCIALVPPLPAIAARRCHPGGVISPRASARSPVSSRMT